MRLKLLIFPFFALLSLVIIIGFMKPDFDSILEKKSAIANQQTVVDSADIIVKQVATLNSDLDLHSKAENILLTYLPRTLEQDSIIDAFNFTASQTGLVVSDIVFTKETVNTVSADDLGDTLATNPSSLDTQKVAPQTFIFTGTMTGPYEGMKTFFDRFTRINRFQNIILFSLEKGDAAPGSTVSSDSLKGTITVQYGYLKDKPVSSALNLAFLQKSEPFDFSPIDTLETRMAEIAPLGDAPSGKPNPFQ